MVVIRVSGLTTRVEEKQIRTYFKNPRNGGGPINAIYYPLKFNEAVIFLQNQPNNAEGLKTLTSNRHVVGDDTVVVRVEPDAIFSNVNATVTDPGICALLQKQRDLFDELKFGSDLKITHNISNSSFSMEGNMYQVEWAWNYLNFQIPKKHRMSSASSLDDGYMVPQSPNKPTKSQTLATTRRVSLPGSSNERALPPLPSQRTNSPDYDEVGSLNFTDNPLFQDKNASRGIQSHRKTVSGAVRVLPETPRHQPSSSTNDSYVTMALSSDSKSFVIDKRMTITVEKADITKAKSAAIVISTDPDMNNSVGVAKSVADKAGGRFREDCAKVINYKRQLKFCDVVHTCAGGELQSTVKHVVQVCVPPWNADSNHISQHKLVETYCRLLLYVEETLKVPAITSTLLGTDKLSIPIGVTISALLDAVHVFLSRSKHPPRLKEVTLMSLNENHVKESIMDIQCFSEMKFNEYLALAMEKYDESLLTDMFPKLKPDGSRDPTDTDTVYVKLSRLRLNTP